MSVEQTTVVDVIHTDAVTGKVCLTVSDHLPWDQAHLAQLQEKLNTYLRYIESGEIYQSYPKSTGRELLIKVALKHRPTAEALSFLEGARQAIVTAGFEFEFGPLAAGYSDDDG